MAEQLTQLHIVNGFPQALAVAHELGAVGIGLDLEGVLIRYVGNEPVHADLHAANGAPNTQLLATDMASHPEVSYGVMTNNTNKTPEKCVRGVVAHSAGFYYGDIPFVHKGMFLGGEEPLGAKPSGEQGILLANMLGVDPSDMVLIDDQGLKNAGEAVNAGFKAIIAPPPIGRDNRFNRVIEHRGVMAGRFVEPAIMRSLERNGRLAQAAFQRVAGIDIAQLAGPIRH